MRYRLIKKAQAQSQPQTSSASDYTTKGLNLLKSIVDSKLAKRTALLGGVGAVLGAGALGYGQARANDPEDSNEVRRSKIRRNALMGALLGGGTGAGISLGDNLLTNMDYPPASPISARKMSGEIKYPLIGGAMGFGGSLIRTGISPAMISKELTNARNIRRRVGGTNLIPDEEWKRMLASLKLLTGTGRKVPKSVGAKFFRTAGGRVLGRILWSLKYGGPAKKALLPGAIGLGAGILYNKFWERGLKDLGRSVTEFR